MVASWVLLEMLCIVVGTCAWGEEGRGFVDAGGWMYIVGELIASGISNLQCSQTESSRTKAGQMSP